MNCRHCANKLTHTFLDLGYAPPSNDYLTKEKLNSPETYFPLRAKVCEKCWLVQTEDYNQADELFNDEYAYFSSTSSLWLKHAEQYSKKIIHELNLNQDSFVIEIASNDGYLLKNFKRFGIPCIGIEPTVETAKAAEELGVRVIREFFTETNAQKLILDHAKADLIIGNNVYAHVPDINDFTKGLKTALKIGGTITLEFPHLLQLINKMQFDTVYHEHFSYLSLIIVDRIFRKFDLKVFKVEKLETHGGSLRVYGCHDEDKRVVDSTVKHLIDEEYKNGLNNLETYISFQSKAEKIKNNLIEFLINKKKSNKKVLGFGAAAKGNTFLNFSGIKPDLIEAIGDSADSKQSKYMPGSHIPIVSPEEIVKLQPDYLIIFPWNIATEIYQQFKDLLPNTKFVIALPKIQELN